MKAFFKYAAVFFITTSNLLPGESPLMIQGCIAVDGDENARIPELAVIFNGTHTKTTKEGLFSLRVDPSVKTYKLILCKALHQNFEKANTLTDVSLLAKHRCEIISLKCVRDDKGSLYCSSQDCTESADGVLKCEARSLEDGQKIDPENSIIVCIDPKYADRIEPWNVSLSSNFVTLPRIVLKKNSPEELAKLSAKSLLGSLDVQTFHEPVKRKKQMIDNGKVVLSLVQ